MFFSEANIDAPQPERPAPATAAVVAVTAASTVLLGIAPQPLFDLTIRAGDFLR
jgi:NADH-quinone oxidoreductase subunit N